MRERDGTKTIDAFDIDGISTENCAVNFRKHQSFITSLIRSRTHAECQISYPRARTHFQTHCSRSISFLLLPGCLFVQFDSENVSTAQSVELRARTNQFYSIFLIHCPQRINIGTTFYYF